MVEEEKSAEVADHKGHGKFRYKPLILACLILAIIACSIVVVWIVASGDEGDAGEKRLAPELVGLSEDEAVSLLAGQNITFEIAYEEVEDSQVGHVLGQDPSAGMSVGEQGIITITVGKTRGIEMPNLIGMSKEEAIASLQALGLNPSLLEQVTLVTSENGVILSQEPASGTFLEQRSTVTISVGVYNEPAAADKSSTPPATTYVTCPTCNGSGTVIMNVSMPKLESCTNCNGLGMIYDGSGGAYPCSVCGGRGRFTTFVDTPKETTCYTCGGSGRIRN